MGLTLPGQISVQAVAALGTSWPQVDEDSVDALAAVFDRSADELDSHALDADRHTQGVLAASSGGLASGLTRAAGVLVGGADSSAATTAAQLRRASSELVADAARVRGTKVWSIEVLSTLTERLAALDAVGPLTAGASSVLMADEVDQAARSIAHQHTLLVQELTPAALPTAGTAGPVTVMAPPVLPTAATTTNLVTAIATGSAGGAGHAGSDLSLPAQLAGRGPDLGSAVTDTGERTPAASVVVPHRPETELGGPDLHGSGPSDVTPVTGNGPGALHPGIAGVSAQAVAAQDLAPPPMATVTPAAGLSPVGGAAGTPATMFALPGNGGPASGLSSVGASTGQPSTVPPTGPSWGSSSPPLTAGPGATGPGATALPSSTAAATRPAAPAAVVVDGAPSPGAPGDGRARVSRAEDPSALLLFAAFPAGTAPLRTARPARQLPLPVRAARPGLCCPPGDHPARPDLALAPHPASLPVAVSIERTDLLRGWDPLGGGSERDLERRFVVRPATEGHPAEHSWPPSELHPEGAVAPDRRRPVRLEVGALLDLLGSPEGRVLAAGGTPFARRAEPAGYTLRPLYRLRVARTLPAWESHLSAWFAQPGGGLRYRLTHPVAELVASGWLVDAREEEPGGC